MIHSLAEWLQDLSVVIQTAAALGIMAVTFVYVFLSKKFFNRKPPSCVVLTSAVSTDRGITAVAENHGDSDALSTSVIISFAERRGKKRSFVLLGPNIIRPGEKAVFRIKEPKKGSRGMTARIRYRDQMRPKRTEVWSISKKGTITYIGREWGIIAFLSWLTS